MCPRCGRKSKKAFKGYCSEVHLLLSEGKKGNWVRLHCSVCDRLIFRRPSKVPKGGKAVCPRCSKNKGENHGNYRGARYFNPSGYVMILIKDHYVLEHRHIWQQVNRACLLKWQPVHIHHIDFNKSNNNPNNLLCLMDHEHHRVHMFLRLGRKKDAYEIMRKRAEEQWFYPKQVDLYKTKVNSKISTKEK